MPATHRTHAPDLGLTALRELHHDTYLRYAALLLPAAGSADRALREAFADLADSWRDALATASPIACAWQTVRQHVRHLAGPGPLGPVVHLTTDQQDLFLLYVVLDLSEQAIAALTGTEEAAVRTQIRSLDTQRAW
ncbi:sigma factor-like helix-turn-helix DNA-binding protein [Kitasatospora sp. NPDC059646]|uniref:sigma-70 region 4 domain-containing protein n=1 Tax=Kitasatospora sp. NPDC059646 TaxID=3346893 RepID=UPI0036B08F97